MHFTAQQPLEKNNSNAAGPVDGPAIFDNVKGCHISVAAQQLQVRGSADSEFAVYSANKPTIEHSTGVSWLARCPDAARIQKPWSDLAIQCKSLYDSHHVMWCDCWDDVRRILWVTVVAKLQKCI